MRTLLNAAAFLPCWPPSLRARIACSAYTEREGERVRDTRSMRGHVAQDMGNGKKNMEKKGAGRRARWANLVLVLRSHGPWRHVPAANASDREEGGARMRATDRNPCAPSPCLASSRLSGVKQKTTRRGSTLYFTSATWTVTPSEVACTVVSNRCCSSPFTATSTRIHSHTRVLETFVS